jgi:hypothetical protein
MFYRQVLNVESQFDGEDYLLSPGCVDITLSGT